MNTGPVVRSAYLEQVRRIAPDGGQPGGLKDRDTELTELATFCTADTGRAYVWWRAKAWAGKSALMSWFVLNPPSGVRIVSFFITARYAENSDRTAFVDVLLEQLADLLNQSMPAFLTHATREAHLRALLAEAARACGQRGERLVLVVDGLDEDRGVTVGADAYSIAAILPIDPPAGMRIIVAGRPNPRIPTDVPDDHPLRDPTIVEDLSRSEHAKVVRADAERELKRLLHGTPAEQDLLGLLTAAGGGLSGIDLAELTGWSHWEVEEHLHAVSGRTFTSRDGHWRRNTQMYVLGHEELQQKAVRDFGDIRLGTYRQRLHTWAEGYRTQSWPPETPEYLLRGYFRLLQDTNDLPRMIMCGTDLNRHNRMLDITGGDATALAEIVTTQQQVIDRPAPDLGALAQLVIHRDFLITRNTDMPGDLPAVWVQLGNPARGEALAQSIPDAGLRAWALATVAVTVATVGDPDRAEAIASRIDDPYSQVHTWIRLVQPAIDAGDLDRARSLAAKAENRGRSIAEPTKRDTCLGELLPAVAAIGDLQWAYAIADSIADPIRQARSLAGAASKLAAGGDLDNAERIALSIADPSVRVQTLVDLTRSTVVHGDSDQMNRLTATAEAGTWLVLEPAQQVFAMRIVAPLLMIVGAEDKAETMVSTIADPIQRALAMVNMATAAIDCGDTDKARTLTRRAEDVAQSISDTERRSEVLAALCPVLAITGDVDGAEILAGLISDSFQQTAALAKLAEVVAASADLDRAETIARNITYSDHQDQGLTKVSLTAAAHGNHHRAQELALSITSPVNRTSTLTELGQAMADNPKHAATLCRQARSAAGDIVEREAQARALAVLARAVASFDAGEAEDIAVQAEAVARCVTVPTEQASTLISLARALIDDDPVRARTLTAHAEAVACTITEENQRIKIMAALVSVIAAIGDLDRAEELARSVDQSYRDLTISALVPAIAAAGHMDRAEELTECITDAWRRDQVLNRLAVTLAQQEDTDRAEKIARRITSPHDHARTLCSLTRITAASGNLERARTLAVKARHITDTVSGSDNRALALTALTLAEASIGDHRQAEATSESIDDPLQQIRALAASAQAVAADDLDHARDLVERAKAIALRSGYDLTQASYPSPTQTAADVLSLNQFQADSAARSHNLMVQDYALAALVPALAVVESSEQARKLAYAIIDHDRRTSTLTTLAQTLDTHDDSDNARRVIANTLVGGRLHLCIPAIRHIDQAAITIMADEYLNVARCAAGQPLSLNAPKKFAGRTIQAG